MNKYIFLKLKLFCSILFNKRNLSKVFIIFVVGFFSRLLINYYFDLNVFVDYLNIVSLFYYFLMSCFIISVHNLFDFFDLSSITDLFKFFSFRKIYFDSSSRDSNIHKVIKSDFNNIPIKDKIRRRTS
jgi:hypothetical protein